MRRLLLTAAALASFAAAPAIAGDQDFTVINKTGYQIDQVYVSAVGTKSWGNDIMGRGALADGAGVDITFAHGASACKWDMKVVYNDGDTAEWGNLDLCSISKVSLFYDRKAGTTRAVSE